MKSTKRTATTRKIKDYLPIMNFDTIYYENYQKYMKRIT